jgi:BolA family transcriptional regulator, general stress-responsive regulator
MTTVAAQLRASLERALQPSHLEIEDESARHHGHAGWREDGETHFRVVLVSDRFDGRSRIERQRLVHAAAGDLLVERIHALSIRALTPAEAAAA